MQWQVRMEAPATEEQVVRWWHRWPEANVGVLTGRVSGVVVVDVDPRSGGDRSLLSFEARWGALPSTVESHTGGGGRHVWLSFAELLPSAVLAPGLELKAERSVVVAPPSIHASGHPYRWAPGRSPDKVSPEPVPGWLAALAYGDSQFDPRHPLADPPVRTTQEQAEFAETWARAGVELEPGDRYYLCPFHDDHHPSLHVDSRACRWFCFGCRRGGGVGRLRRLLGDAPRPLTRARVRGHAGRHGSVTVPGTTEVEVVGEAQHQDALLALAGGSRSFGGVELEAIAELAPDPADPKDVAVLIDGAPVGRLRREDVTRLATAVQGALSSRGSMTCRALIRGGWDRGGEDLGRFGVVLFL